MGRGGGNEQMQMTQCESCKHELQLIVSLLEPDLGELAWIVSGLYVSFRV